MTLQQDTNIRTTIDRLCQGYTNFDDQLQKKYQKLVNYYLYIEIKTGRLLAFAAIVVLGVTLL